MNNSPKSASQVQTATNTRQGVVGIGIFAFFLVASVMVTQTVQALNIAAGNYGYYGGTYGYNTSTSSDDIPEAPTGLTQTNVSTTSLTLTWTAPVNTETTNTAISTGSGSIASYKIGYSTGTVSTCTSGTATTSTSATVNLTGLDSNTTYNVKICAVDNNLNTGTALSSTFVTSSGGGSSGGSSGGSGGATSVFSSTPTTVVSTPSGNTITLGTIGNSTVVGDAAALTASLGITRNQGLETAAAAQVAALVRKTGVQLSALDTLKATNFIAYGVDANTIKLGLGERKNLVGEILAIYSSLNVNTLAELAAGKKPTQRTLVYERKQVGLVRDLLVRLTGKKLDFKVASVDLAYNSMIYPVRFPGRDLKKEGAAAAKFKKIVGRTPTSPLDWSGVRAIAYTGLKTK